MQFLILSNDISLSSTISNILKGFDKKANILVAKNTEEMFVIINRSGIDEFALIFMQIEALGDGWQHTLGSLKSKVGAAKMVFSAKECSHKMVTFLMRLGARAFIPADYDATIKNFIIGLALKDCFYFPPNLIYDMRLENKTITDYCTPEGRKLTKRQIQILGHLAKGDPNKVIAFEMGVSEATVKLHVNAVLRTLNVKNRTQAFIVAQQMGFV